MSTARFSFLALSVLLLPVLWGCSHCHPQPACPPTGAVAAPGPPAGAVAPPVFPSPTAPAASVLPPPPAQSNFEPPPAPLPAAPPAPSPPQAQGWQPADSTIRLAPPIPSDDTRRLPTGSKGSSVPEQRTPPPSLPVGIPQFALAKDRVAAGLRPMLDDGLDWLQANGYRTVLHVLRPGEDDSADRRQVEKRGMTYLRLEVSPQTLSRPLVDRFNVLVGDTARYPLFVYDRDGSLAGGLWYLHFRTAEQASDETARIRASRLGLREDDPNQRDMWLAIQRLLGER
jgi:hypothetical protein